VDASSLSSIFSSKVKREKNESNQSSQSFGGNYFQSLATCKKAASVRQSPDIDSNESNQSIELFLIFIHAVCFPILLVVVDDKQNPSPVISIIIIQAHGDIVQVCVQPFISFLDGFETTRDLRNIAKNGMNRTNNGARTS
jgi:hypothetical protein